MKLMGWQRILMAISKTEKPYSLKITRDCDLTPGAVHINLKQLEKERYLNLNIGDDKRKRQITLTDKGQNIAEVLNENHS